MSKKFSRPLIGLTLDTENPKQGSYSRYPFYALRENYMSAVQEAGGLPVGIPADPALAEAYLEGLDGLIITGGAFDIDPSLYGDATKQTLTVKDRRTKSELALAKGALAKKIPLLGICGGEQLLAVALGGTLIQHIPDEIPGALPHEQNPPHTKPAHRVMIKEGTKLAEILQCTELSVNTAHHQAVKTAGLGTVNALSPDGVIEGLELTDHPFCLGVQWHPEFYANERDFLLFKALIGAAL